MRSSALRLCGFLCASGLLALAACSSSSDSDSAPAASDETWQPGNSDAGGVTGKAGSAGAMSGQGGSSQGYGGAAGSAGSGIPGENDHAGAGGSAGAWADAGAADAALPPEDASVAEEAGGEAGEDGGDLCAALDQSKPLVLYQSADDSNSMASPVIARSMINSGVPVPGNMVRPYEFLNYYQIRFDPAPHGQVRVVPQMRPGAADGQYDLQIGVQAELAPSPRRTLNIIFVLDTSGSMSGNPISLERAAVRAIAASMQAGDRVSMVTWNTQQSVLLDNHVVQGPNDPVLIAKAESLQADGGTDLHSGLVKGYELAKKTYQPAIMNRLVLISDGGANVGITDEELIAQESHSADGEGIYLVGVGVGSGYNDVLMNTVTDKGRGAYVFLDTAEEATRVFGDRFDETMEVAVRDVRLELTVPWYFALESTSAEQTSTNPDEVDPQYLAPSDAIIFHNKFVACSPQMVNPSDPIFAKATYTRPFTHEPSSDSASSTVGELLGGADAQLKKGRAIVAYAKALSEAQAPGADPKALIDEAIAAADAADPAKSDAELNEIRLLLEKYRTQF